MPADDVHPTPHLLITLCRLATRAEAPATQLLAESAGQLASALGDTALISLVVDAPGKPAQLEIVGVADSRAGGATIVEDLKGVRIDAGRGLTQHVLEAGASLWLPTTTPGIVLVGRPELRDYAERFGIRSLILAPMTVRQQALGQVAMIRADGGPPYSQQDEQVVQAAACVLALALASGPDPPASVPLGEPRPRAASAAELTGRERQVLALLAVGHTNREIAERLVLSVRTVEWHRGRIQGKLGVTGRAALALAAREHGLTK